MELNLRCSPPQCCPRRVFNTQHTPNQITSLAASFFRSLFCFFRFHLLLLGLRFFRWNGLQLLWTVVGHDYATTGRDTKIKTANRIRTRQTDNDNYKLTHVHAVRLCRSLLLFIYPPLAHCWMLNWKLNRNRTEYRQTNRETIVRLHRSDDGIAMRTPISKMCSRNVIVALLHRCRMVDWSSNHSTKNADRHSVVCSLRWKMCGSVCCDNYT